MRVADTTAARRFFKLPAAEQMTLLVAQARALANGRYAPVQSIWNARCADAGLPHLTSLKERGITWPQIVAAAGLEIESNSARMKRNYAASIGRREQRALTQVEHEQRIARLTLADVRRSWPLTAFDTPRWEETFVVGEVLVTRIAHGLR